MPKKLKCVLVDTDMLMHQVIDTLCEGSSHAEVIKHYDCPKTFLKEQVKLDYDICLLDLNMSGLDGILVAQLLNDKPVIFVTGSNERLMDAIDFGPIDILLKPLKKEKFENALAKVDAILNRNTIGNKTQANESLLPKKY